MSSSALFAGLSPQECREFLLYAKIRTFGRNEALFNQRETIDKLIFILTGRVKLTQLSPEGSEVILWMNLSRDAIGLRTDTVGGDNHSCSGRAMERAQALLWDYKQHAVLIARYPQLKTNIGRILEARLRELEERFTEIATERVATRLASILIRLVRSGGKQSRDGLEVALRQEELAQMTGTTHCTICRILRKWTESGFIIRRRDGVLIRDMDRLKALPI
jgi:CRP-like cAMP-binding protein